MKEQFRGAATALFFAGSMLAYAYFFHPELIGMSEESVTGSRGASEESEVSELEETIRTLEDTNEALTMQLQELTEEITALEDEDRSADSGSPEDAPAIHAMLEISAGETSSDISERLFDLRLIDSRNQFEATISDSGLSQQIQTGSYFLTSEMDSTDIIETITTP
ncbi:hypothetical protein [Salisediminibacterium beveridgei]|uniref:Uncharacterized protein n=1 Tax=Salisediminibacterium beveridgei TaxID=632773 RepID=A0A1D7QUD1_9BACI|nr:hypothetical protein [Salisediminibacterium beveridgei]AOM82626.1 hypothetical protein BBEV_1261 [Salisediminibacterium beveridgei]